MNRKETENELKSTRNIKGMWKWIIGVGIVLMIIAFWGSYFNHDQNFIEKQNPESVEKDSVGQKTMARDVVIDSMEVDTSKF